MSAACCRRLVPSQLGLSSLSAPSCTPLRFTDYLPAKFAVLPAISITVTTSEYGTTIIWRRFACLHDSEGSANSTRGLVGS